MINWRRGQVIVTRNRVAQEGPLDEFLDGLAAHEATAHPHPDVAVFLCRGQATRPRWRSAQRSSTPTRSRERVVIVSVDTVSIPHVETFDRCAVEVLGHGLFKVVHLTARFGYHDKLNIPERARAGAQARPARAQPRPRARLLLRLAHHHHPHRRPGHASAGARSCSSRMARNARAPIDHFGLPSDRTVIMGSQVAL